MDFPEQETELRELSALSDEQLRQGEEVFRLIWETNHTLDEFKHKYLTLIETGLREVGRA